MGMPIHGRGGIRIENNDGIDGPLTIWNMPDGVLMTAEGVDCSTTNDIELGMATQEGQDTYIIDTVTFWGATKPPTVLRGSVCSMTNRGGVTLVPTTVDFSALTAPDLCLDVPTVPPGQPKLAARYARLLWKPSVVENMRINIAVYRRLLRQSEVF
ncbi:hypothetical protein FPV16_14885 [Methylobacterium sp. W2]|uniref:hypothetical protein n=1 Tax=Methylobacterium sp. W2 TaxID=2598107 RepID=UPI001D0C74AB|nr:hypothetical protein [Methylobacterium sp. W2]MCC0807499.1 hypothetical protein [Methylobacterium sp. W2]